MNSLLLYTSMLSYSTQFSSSTTDIIEYDSIISVRNNIKLKYGTSCASLNYPYVIDYKAYDTIENQICLFEKFVQGQNNIGIINNYLCYKNKDSFMKHRMVNNTPRNTFKYKNYTFMANYRAGIGGFIFAESRNYSMIIGKTFTTQFKRVTYPNKPDINLITAKNGRN